MKKLAFYWSVFKYGAKSRFIYRTSTVLDMIGTTIQFLAQILIWKALLGQEVRFDTSFQEMVTYLSITKLVTTLAATSAGNQISKKIQDGSISLDFVQPYNMKSYLFFNDLGNNIFKGLVVILPVCFFVALGFGFVFPQNLVQAVAFIITVAFGTVIMFYYSYILGIASFWMIRNPFLSWHFRNVETLLSGQFIPIWFYPGWLSTITQYLPFRYFTYEPISIFLGKTSPSRVWTILLIQIFWVLLLYIAERKIWSKAYKKLIVQGG